MDGISRRDRRLLRQIDIKLNGYLSHFCSVCKFDREELNWDNDSEEEYLRLKRAWKVYCRSKNYGEQLITAFHWKCMIIKVKLILEFKYNKDAGLQEEREILAWLKKGMKPLEVADKSVKELKGLKVLIK